MNGNILYNSEGVFSKIYLLYSFLKIAVISLILVSETILCADTVILLLVLCIAIDVYELVFFLVIHLYASWNNRAASNTVLRSGQSSFEILRIVVTSALALFLMKNSECIKSRTGVISIILVLLSALKILLFLTIGFFYCVFLRNTDTSPRLRQINEDDLENFKVEILEEGEECPICMDSTANGSKCALLPCNHYFHFDCLKKWVIVKGACPVCRKSVSN